MKQIIKVQDDCKSISICIYVQKDKLLKTTILGNPSALKIKLPSKQSRKQESSINQPQILQTHITQILNPTLYQTVPPPKVIVNKTSASPEFATFLIYKKQE